ncbi:RFC checkpoint protein Rad17 [Friedmanniomyces endolithicus]|nr:RFC checkpoint protein Rad17 [Friedmanniomyces endolithicus]KAK0778653.1 RFC checkpoint protein Rad17 [Friedmanniomyces endolithicus]KAK0790508.1 RFC checkpoint protein Rad17 [Friedmanniomyces endolithicus]KAK0867391.1 RFC checkpoint protein Rad17 [Friedmanniomyces endolithicus]KAK0891789.1 RFC checkpoint protein Rad17 [Friedmanniomyces endolithicus]
MAPSRAPRRRALVVSSDEEYPGEEKPVSGPSEDDEPVKPRKGTTGKLKAVDKTKSPQQLTTATSTPEGSSQKSPARRKAGKTKTKTAVKSEPLPNGKSIFSFFNATTQRQQLSQPSASPQKPTQEEPEAIHDQTDDDGTAVSLSKGSSTALAVRKRKSQQTVSTKDDAFSVPSATQKFRKTNDGSRIAFLGVVNEDKRPWTEQFAPLDLSDLAVHKRKVADVRQWLESAVDGKRQKVLVLKGAAGTGKTTTIRLLAKELGATVSEWQNPAGADPSTEGSTTTAGHFEDFVRRVGKSSSLSFAVGDHVEAVPDHVKEGVDRTKQIVLVEEFPNTFSRTSATLQSFRSTLLQYVSSPAVQEARVTPIVMIISETLLSTNTAAADSFTAHRLLGPELLNHPLINTIEFNPVASTFLTKALETIVLKEARKSGRRRTPGPQVLKRLAETGDIRSAVSSLEFLCLRGDDTESWSSRIQFTKPKKKPVEPLLTKAEDDALRLVSNRESSLGIFHAVGRVVYNNRISPPSGQSPAEPPPWLPQHRRPKIPERDVDSLIDELGTETSTFIAALHENYALSCTSSSSTETTLASLSDCAENISDADLLSVDRFAFGTRAFSGSAVDGLRQDEMAFQVAVRGLLFSLPFPVHRSSADAHRMFYPASLKLWKRREEVEGMVELLTAQAQSGSLDGVREAYQPRGAVRGEGVEAWSRNTGNFVLSAADQITSDDDDAPRSTVTQAEMLLERLPFLAQILAARQRTEAPSLLLRNVLSVSRMTGRTDDATAAEEPEDEDAPAPGDAWSTDKPDLDDGDHSKLRTKTKEKSGGKEAMGKTEGGGLAIPVEMRVERLVLEEDDIVD